MSTVRKPVRTEAAPRMPLVIASMKPQDSAPGETTGRGSESSTVTVAMAAWRSRNFTCASNDSMSPRTRPSSCSMDSISLTSFAASKKSRRRFSWARRLSSRADWSTCCCVTSSEASDWYLTVPTAVTSATNCS